MSSNLQAAEEDYRYFKAFLKQTTPSENLIHLVFINMNVETAYLVEHIIRRPFDKDGITFRAAKTLHRLGELTEITSTLCGSIPKPKAPLTIMPPSVIGKAGELLLIMGDMMSYFMKSATYVDDTVFVARNQAGSFQSFTVKVTEAYHMLWRISGLPQFSDLLELVMILHHHPQLFTERNSAIASQPYIAIDFETKSMGKPLLSIHYRSPLIYFLNTNKMEATNEWMTYEDLTLDQLAETIISEVKIIITEENKDKIMQEFCNILGVPYQEDILENRKMLYTPLLAHSSMKSFKELWRLQQERRIEEMSTTESENDLLNACSDVGTKEKTVKPRSGCQAQEISDRQKFKTMHEYARSKETSCKNKNERKHSSQDE